MKPPTASEMDEMTREDEMTKFSIKVIEFQVPKLVAKEVLHIMPWEQRELEVLRRDSVRHLVEIFNYASGRSLGKLVMSSSEWQALQGVLVVGSEDSGEVEIEWEYLLCP